VTTGGEISLVFSGIIILMLLILYFTGMNNDVKFFI